MKLSRFETETGGIDWRIEQDGITLPHSQLPIPADVDEIRLIAGWPEYRTVVEQAVKQAFEDAGSPESGSQDVTAGCSAEHELVAPSPLARPPKVLCVGQNYEDHVREMGGQVGELPVIFNKFPSVVCGPGHPIRLPPVSTQVDYEGELVVVIGLAGRDIPVERAWDHVFGFTCGNDVSARDWQKGRPGGQWLLGKSCDTFAPIGPAIVTRESVRDPQQLAIQTRLNGQQVQNSCTSRLIFKIDFLISHLSSFFTLEPGDLIFTGTPPGVGAARTPPLFLKPGDVVEVEIESLGCLRNPVVSA